MKTEEQNIPDIVDETAEMEKTFESFRDHKSDPGFLVAKGRFDANNDDDRQELRRKHVKKLASAIFMAMTNHGYATIRAVGPFANDNAVKALTLATGYCASRGIELCWTSSESTGNLGRLRKEGHVDSVSATCYTIKDWKDWKETDLSNIPTTHLEDEIARRKRAVTNITGE